MSLNVDDNGDTIDSDSSKGIYPANLYRGSSVLYRHHHVLLCTRDSLNKNTDSIQHGQLLKMAVMQ